MNRLVAPSSGPASPPFGAPVMGPTTKPPAKTTYEKNRFASSRRSPSLVTFSPTHYEPKYAYPLVVWLHGARQTPHDLPEVMANLSTRNYVAIAPQATGESSEPWRQDAPDIAAARQRIFDAVEIAVERFHVHTGRVFLAGAGCGGTAALRIALANPDRFAGAASFDGPVPRGHSPLLHVKAARGLPLLLAYGESSPRYPLAEVCRDLRLFHSAGMKLSMQQEPGDGDLTTSMLAEFDRWMMNIVCESKAAVC